ncbi:MAG: M1 family metallopeptidase [Bacteroidetes bacterium]|nr:M1 family metallopeptidase [Bacteroidota bacterium]
MQKRVFIWMVAMLVAVCAQADTNKTKGSGAKTTSATPEEDYYDVQYLKFDIKLTNTSTAVSGNVITVAKATASMNVYAFELNNTLIIDSAKINNVILPVATTGDIRKITLGSALSSGTTFTAQVFYHGSTAAGTGQFFIHGLNPVVDNGFTLMYSLSDKDLASDWWPSKQSIQDKVDSVDMWVTVDDTLKACSNGLLKKTTIMPGNQLRYEWKTIYPIDYYLIMVAVAPYNEYSYQMHYTDGSNDSMLIQNFVYNTPGSFTATAKAALDSTGLIVDYFSSKFGRYPFDKEKYGHCMSPLGGGMEHQTMTTMGTGAYSDVTLISHELGHQWWGDNVTYANWAEIWLSEGFASYCEQLFVEKFRGAQAFYDYRTKVFNNAMVPTGSVYVDDTTSVGRIFNTALTYKKGASVVHMLRYLAPNDSLFFVVLKTYQQQFKNGFALTTDLKHIAEQTYGTSLDSFFRQWVYGEGYPRYAAKWAQQGSTVVIEIDQTTTKSTSVPCFWMPLEIKLKSVAGNRIIKLYNNTPTQTFVTAWDSTLTGIEIDPNNHVLNSLGAITQDQSILNVKKTLVDNDLTVSPNPAEDEWLVEHIPANAFCTLTDISGMVVWSKVCSNTIAIPAKQLPKGNYSFSVRAAGVEPKSLILVK